MIMVSLLWNKQACFVLCAVIWQLSYHLDRLLFASLRSLARSLQELSDEDVLGGLIQGVLHVVEELGHTDVVVLEELDDVHALSVLCLALCHVGVLLEELGH